MHGMSTPLPPLQYRVPYNRNKCARVFVTSAREALDRAKTNHCSGRLLAYVVIYLQRGTSLYCGNNQLPRLESRQPNTKKNDACIFSKHLEGGTHTPRPSLHPKVTFRTRRQFSRSSGTHHIPARKKRQMGCGLGAQASSTAA